MEEAEGVFLSVERALVLTAAFLTGGLVGRLQPGKSGAVRPEVVLVCLSVVESPPARAQQCRCLRHRVWPPCVLAGG